MEDCNDNNGGEDAGSRDCLGDLLAGSTVDAKEAEFRKEAEAKLTALSGGVAAEEAAYRAARPALLERWDELDNKIRKLKSHFEDCYDYKCFIQEVICKKVVRPEWALRRKLLTEKLCGYYGALYLAEERLDAAKGQLNAWEKISKSLDDRLTANEALYEEICKLDSCEDRYFAIYILYFELCPAHKGMGEPPEKLDQYNPAEKYCTDTCGEPPVDNTDGLCGDPYLIDPDDYNCKLAEVWTAWRDAGLAKVKAQCDVDEIEKCKQQYEDMAQAEARRNLARESFRRFNPDCCKKRSHDDGEPSQQSQHGS
ncbi:MAG: hypothetical protein AAF350_02025 [Pseudomonadota bacterium]